ncbi:MAG: hypothetical protein ACK53A_11535 [Gemmatimonadota bacterium]|jgi:hypothetical protein
MYTTIIRTLRTPTSERFIFRNGDLDLAALDLHYLPPSRAAGTLTILQGAVTVDDIPALLTRIDAELLPDASLDEGTLEFSVVVGQPIGTFVSSA